MIIHVSVFNWVNTTAEDEIERLLAGVRGIADEVDGIHEIHCGENTSPLTQGLEYAIFVRADDAEALGRYQAHDAHVAAAQAIDLSQSRDEVHQPGVVVDLIT
jgi:heme-degrading monooxygenase HmoA